MVDGIVRDGYVEIQQVTGRGIGWDDLTEKKK